MGIVTFENTVSLDGYVAGPNDGLELPLGEGGMRLFDWYQSGDTELPLPGTDMVFRVSRASAELMKDEWSRLGAMVAGRRMFDIAGAWGGRPPGGGPCFIVTHHPPAEWMKEGSPFTFVTGGIEEAVRLAQKAAGGKNVGISSASILQQCLRAGLMDEITIDLVPILLGGGVRLFDHLGGKPAGLESLGVVVAPGVTHLKFRVVR